MYGLDKLTDTPLLGTVTTKEGAKYNLRVGASPLYIDTFIDKANGA